MKDVISPDGKWLWQGSEWIPAPPTSSPTASIDEEVNMIYEPGSETSPKPPQRPTKASPAKSPMSPGEEPLRSSKSLAGILVSIILFSSIAYFLFGDADSNEVDFSFGSFRSEFWAESGEGVVLHYLAIDDDPTGLYPYRQLYFNPITNEGSRNCEQSPITESETWRHYGSAGESPTTCGWVLDWTLDLHQFDDPVMAPHLNSEDGITYRYICSVEYPTQCLTFIFQYHSSPTTSDYVIVLDADSDCEILAIDEGPYDSFDDDIVNNWRENTFRVWWPKSHAYCNSLTGPSPIEKFFNIAANS